MASGGSSASVPPSPYGYIVTAHKPTAVTAAVTAKLTESDARFLVVSKLTQLEIHAFTPEGLRLVLETAIYGRISQLYVFRPSNQNREFIFISTDRCQYFILSYDKGELKTTAFGDLARVAEALSDNGPHGSIDPDCRAICLRLFSRTLEIIPMRHGRLQDSFSVLLEETEVFSIQFLYQCDKPVIAVLCAEKSTRNVVTYQVNMETKELSEGPWRLNNVEGGALHLIPVPAGGVVIVGEQSLTYYNGNEDDAQSKEISGPISCFTCIDQPGSNKWRYLLVDIDGGLHILSLGFERVGKVTMNLEKLGQTCLASAICYLDNDMVYVGSVTNDGQLVRLLHTRDEKGSFVEVVDTFSNSAPIVDFCVMDLERNGQCEILACCGYGRGSSLRSVRNDVGINELASLELPGLKGVWSVRSRHSSLDTLMVMSFIGETRFLSIKGDELEDIEVPSMVSSEPTLHCSNVGDSLLQVVPSGVRLIAADTESVIAEWKPLNGNEITVVSSSGSQMLLGAVGGFLIYLEVEDDAKIVERRVCQLEYEISCLSIHSLDGGKSELCAVGLWTEVSVRLLRIPTLELLHIQPLGGEIIARSILIIKLEEMDYLLCAQGDGQYSSFLLNRATGAVSLLRRISLGSRPISLIPFPTDTTTSVFVSSDPPTIVYSNGQKLLLSHVNAKDVNFITPLNSESFPKSVVIATDAGLTIGLVNDIQKLHVRSVPLQDSPTCIAHLEKTNTLAVGTITSLEGAELRCRMQLRDSQTLELLDVFDLPTNELVSCVCAVNVAGVGLFYVVGLNTIRPEEDEPTRSQLVLLQVDKRAFRVAKNLEILGSTMKLRSFGESRFLAAVTHRLCIYKIQDSENGKEIVLETGKMCDTEIVDIQVRGNLILVADLMKSARLLRYNPTEGRIDEVRRPYDGAWLVSVAFLNEDTYICSEHNFNIFTLERSSGQSVSEAGRLSHVGYFHVGHLVNSMQPGSLVMLSETDQSIVPTLIFTTSSGMIGVIAMLSKERYDFLLKLQDNLSHVIQGVGNQRHADFRTFKNERNSKSSEGLIDGDLVETFLDLPSAQMRSVVDGANGGTPLGLSVEELTAMVEDLTRLH